MIHTKRHFASWSHENITKLSLEVHCIFMPITTHKPLNLSNQTSQVSPSPLPAL